METHKWRQFSQVLFLHISQTGCRGPVLVNYASFLLFQLFALAATTLMPPCRLSVLLFTFFSASPNVFFQPGVLSTAEESSKLIPSPSSAVKQMSRSPSFASGLIPTQIGLRRALDANPGSFQCNHDVEMMTRWRGLPDSSRVSLRRRAAIRTCASSRLSNCFPHSSITSHRRSLVRNADVFWAKHREPTSIDRTSSALPKSKEASAFSSATTEAVKAHPDWFPSSRNSNSAISHRFGVATFLSVVSPDLALS